jgi:hypothetical protein
MMHAGSTELSKTQRFNAAFGFDHQLALRLGIEYTCSVFHHAHQGFGRRYSGIVNQDLIRNTIVVYLLKSTSCEARCFRRQPLPFEVDITPRSDQIKALILYPTPPRGLQCCRVDKR